MDRAARHALRRQGRKLPALLDEIRNHTLAMSKKEFVGQACSYTLAIWKRLTRFLDYPELELSNNLAENSMRPIAAGPLQLDPYRQQAGRATRSRDLLGR